MASLTMAMAPATSMLRRQTFSTARSSTVRCIPLRNATRALAQPQRQQRSGMAAVHAKLQSEQSEQAQPQLQRASDAELRADGLLMLAAAMMPMLLDVEPAAAGNPLLTGKTVSLVHPAIMFSLLGVSIYTGILGWNYRQARMIPAEVKELKGQLPSDEEAKEKSPLQGQIKELESKRKQLLNGDPRGKHYLWSSLLLGMGITFGIIGPLNTFLRAGKLFPGPHLYAGGAVLVLWAIAAAMVPLMSRNNDTARNVHIGANVLSTGLFLWQVPTGIEIVLKVWANAPWP